MLREEVRCTTSSVNPTSPLSTKWVFASIKYNYMTSAAVIVHLLLAFLARISCL